jgi:hypothetical protein
MIQEMTEHYCIKERCYDHEYKSNDQGKRSVLQREEKNEKECADSKTTNGEFCRSSAIKRFFLS